LPSQDVSSRTKNGQNACYNQLTMLAEKNKCTAKYWRTLIIATAKA